VHCRLSFSALSHGAAKVALTNYAISREIDLESLQKDESLLLASLNGNVSLHDGDYEMYENLTMKQSWKRPFNNF
jgi:hypothetical protein